MITQVQLPNSPEAILESYIAVKKRIDTANAEKAIIEAALITSIDDRKDGTRGSKTFDLSGCKITIGREENMTLEKGVLATLGQIFDDCGIDREFLPIKHKQELDETGVRWLKDNMPTAYSAMARFLTVKPAKTSISVKF